MFGPWTFWDDGVVASSEVGCIIESPWLKHLPNINIGNVLEEYGSRINIFTKSIKGQKYSHVLDRKESLEC